MATRLNPYLAFDGDAAQAMAFYEQVFGGTLDVTTFGQAGMADPAVADRVMHANLHTPTDFTLMASDVPPGQPYQPGGAIAVSLSGDDAGQLRGWWARLSEGGTITMPLERQQWGDDFGMCLDRFGTPWMVNIAGQPG